jgi:hypothetical protein
MTGKPLPTWISEGFEGFYRRFVSGEDSSFREAVQHGQKPRAMVMRRLAGGSGFALFRSPW